ncbi:PREDICTED: LOW QUALITY PROTEIN [Prunus dulcis]|uniref:PREDICTED: LOW QUALITY PROTEIN n=1 Tax=Prunus dulcis TaxID=3755 RepID=A0A5E4GMS8_PRUDU|nr:PREDICTED: LOW QUALITY PROTEIN [Prunus dulcis]
MKSSDRGLQELKLFHTIDRNIYSRLLMGLGFDPILSKYIVALWHTLERQSIGQKFMVNTLFLHDPFFNDLANESFELLKRLYSDCIHPPFEDIDSQFPKLRLLVPVKVSLSSVFNKEHTKQIMEDFVNEVFNLCVDPNVVEAQPSLPAQEACDERPDRHQPNADKNEITLFLTFSRGHPVSEEELRGFFTRKFGECIEAICMGAEERNSQPLFARVVVKSSSDITSNSQFMGKMLP